MSKGSARALHISFAGPFYRFEHEGRKWFFEVHRWHGPVPLKQNGDPRANIPSGFWDMWDVFNALPDDEKQKHRVTE